MRNALGTKLVLTLLTACFISWSCCLARAEEKAEETAPAPLDGPAAMAMMSDYTQDFVMEYYHRKDPLRPAEKDLMTVDVLFQLLDHSKDPQVRDQSLSVLNLLVQHHPEANVRMKILGGYSTRLDSEPIRYSPILRTLEAILNQDYDPSDNPYGHAFSPRKYKQIQVQAAYALQAYALSIVEKCREEKCSPWMASRPRLALHILRSSFTPDHSLLSIQDRMERVIEGGKEF